MNKRKFTQQERLDILREVEQHGIEAIVRKHNISRSFITTGKPSLTATGSMGWRIVITGWIRR
jgi:hypothetical protein